VPSFDTETCVPTALNGVSDEISTSSLEALPAELPVVDLALPILLNQLAASHTSDLLVLDDYHLVTD